MRMNRLAAALALALLIPSFAFAQQGSGQQSNGTPMTGVPINRSTKNSSLAITAGNTFQPVLASIVGASTANTTQRQSLTIQNNNTNTDNCWVFIGSGTATAATSIILAPGQAYTRYWPFVPSDAIQATCTSTNDTLYVDNN